MLSAKTVDAIAYWVVMGALLFFLAVAIVISLSGCSAIGLGKTPSLSVGPSVKSGGQDVSRSSYQVELTRTGFVVSGEVGATNLNYKEYITPNGTTSREVVATSAESMATKTRRSWIAGVTADLSWTGLITIVVVLILALYFLPGLPTKIFGVIGSAIGTVAEKLNLFYKPKTVQAIVERGNAGLAALEPKQVSTYKEAAATVKAPEAVVAVDKMKTSLKLKGC